MSWLDDLGKTISGGRDRALENARAGVSDDQIRRVHENMQQASQQQPRWQPSGTVNVHYPKPNYAEGGEVTPEQEVPQNIMPPQAQPAPEPIAPPNTQLAPYQQAMSSQLAGVQQQAQAESEAGQREAKIAKEFEQPIYDVNQQAQQNLQDYAQEQAAITDDIKAGHIDVNRYMKNLGTSGQVATAIGLILGGIGGAGNGNQALEVLNKNIDRDMESQLQDLKKNEGLLHANMQHFGNLKDAVAMTRLSIANAYANKMEQSAAQSKSLIALARAKQFGGEIIAKYAPELSNVAFRQALLQGAKQGAVQPEQMVQGFVPPAEQPKVAAAIGQARALRSNEKELMNLFEGANQENTVSNRAMSLGREPASVSALKARLLNVIKDDAGRPDEYKVDLMMQNTPQMGDSEAKVRAKRENFRKLLDSHAQELESLPRTYNIDLNQFQSTKPNNRVTPIKTTPKSGE